MTLDAEGTRLQVGRRPAASDCEPCPDFRPTETQTVNGVVPGQSVTQHRQEHMSRVTVWACGSSASPRGPLPIYVTCCPTERALLPVCTP